VTGFRQSLAERRLKLTTLLRHPGWDAGIQTPWMANQGRGLNGHPREPGTPKIGSCPVGGALCAATNPPPLRGRGGRDEGRPAMITRGAGLPLSQRAWYPLAPSLRRLLRTLMSAALRRYAQLTQAKDDNARVLSPRPSMSWGPAFASLRTRPPRGTFVLPGSRRAWYHAAPGREGDRAGRVSIALRLYGHLTESSADRTRVRPPRPCAAIEVRFPRVADWGTPGVSPSQRLAPAVGKYTKSKAGFVARALRTKGPSFPLAQDGEAHRAPPLVRITGGRGSTSMTVLLTAFGGFSGTDAS